LPFSLIVIHARARGNPGELLQSLSSTWSWIWIPDQTRDGKRKTFP